MRKKHKDSELPAFLRFDDFDRLVETIRDWDLDFRQLDAGPLSAEIFRACSGEVALQRFRFSRALDQRGCSPPGSFTFGFLDDGVSDVRWCGRDATDGLLLAFAKTGEFDALSGPGFGGYTYTVTEKHLARVAQTLGLTDTQWRHRSPTLVSPRRDRGVAKLRHLAKNLCDALARDGALLDHADFREQLDFELPGRLLSMATSHDSRPRRDPAPVRRAAVQKARAFVRDRLDHPLTIRQLCEHAGVSWRTLEYAFREQLDMTPQAYLKAIRLDEARRRLRSGSNATVAEAAHGCGFWHMGKFAADYRIQFGELPSETHQRSGP